MRFAGSLILVVASILGIHAYFVYQWLAKWSSGAIGLKTSDLAIMPLGRFIAFLQETMPSFSWGLPQVATAYYYFIGTLAVAGFALLGLSLLPRKEGERAPV